MVSQPRNKYDAHATNGCLGHDTRAKLQYCFYGCLLIGFGLNTLYFTRVVVREQDAMRSSITLQPDKLPSYKNPYEPENLPLIIARRPNWRTDYNLVDWLPRWLPQEARDDFVKSTKSNPHQSDRIPSTKEEKQEMDEYFWEHVVDPSNGWKTKNPSGFTYAIANNGFGHRLSHLAYSYMCNVVPQRRQQLLSWDAPGEDTNVVWHRLLDNSPVLTGVPPHWTRSDGFNIINEHRKTLGQQGDILADGVSKGADCNNGDYNMYFNFECGGSMCSGYESSRELWLLRAAREPSVQEFYQLLRAQLGQHVKDKIASFIEENFPKNKVVVGVHIRSGNGKDDNFGHFDSVRRGDWLKDMPAAVAMVRKHARMVAHSLIDRYTAGGGPNGIDFAQDEYDEAIDNEFRIFLATDSDAVLEEFRRQDPTVLSLPQERMPVGGGVPINSPLHCFNASRIECTILAEEAMFMDAMILSSCDALLAESYSNYLYTIPATLHLAEGRVFCETGRAALGGKYMLGGRENEPNLYGAAGWWVHPPPNIMPVRCYQGAWAARDRFNLNNVQDVP